MRYMKIVIYWQQLKNGIDQETYKIAKTKITGNELIEQAYEAQTDGSAFDETYCLRRIQEGLEVMADVLHKFWKKLTPISNKMSNPANVEVGDVIEYTDDAQQKTGKVTMVTKTGVTDTLRFTVMTDSGTTIVDDAHFVRIVNKGELNNKLDTTTTAWELELSFDERRQRINEKLFVSELNHYLELNVLSEWSKIALPAGMEQDYISRQTVCETNIRRIAFRKEEPLLDDID